MFVAIDAQKRTYNVLHATSKAQLRILRQQTTFFCPVCNEPVRLKIGSHNQPHFAHIRTSNCPEFERESAYHLKGKEKLYQWLHRQKFNVEIEKYIPDIAQRPDLMASKQDVSMAIEYQCSTISCELLVKRTMSYWRQGIRVIWIWGGNQLKRRGSHWLHLSDMQALSVQQSGILYFCPEAMTIMQCTPLIPFSSATAFSHIIPHSLRTSQFSGVMLQQRLDVSTLLNEWNRKKKIWRHHGLYLKHSQSPFLKYLYKKGISPSCFPPEVLIPLPSLIGFHTAPLLWQTHILLEELGCFSTGDTFAASYIYNRLMKMVKIRRLPYLSPALPKKALLEYFQFLCGTGMLAQRDTYTYQKLREPLLPFGETEAYEMDKEVIQHTAALFPTTLLEENRI
ncbi:competence protein CoiA family protein [Ectobacillus antri]|uniref:Competence protein CoiA family protein n=1 Tax=Ectobacillus antri TaxID=2486280 RepID=A0ABT6H5Q1_9BACI|nr:competence protein CoiA family protein [Ectobacillus antri]MDG4656642.1 competence protein CoiA family protein [Ectobacillus antri]MDG5753995.1 competence protein CoiA family protein [Ectobacillus antri]